MRPLAALVCAVLLAPASLRADTAPKKPVPPSKAAQKAAPTAQKPSPAQKPSTAQKPPAPPAAPGKPAAPAKPSAPGKPTGLAHTGHDKLDDAKAFCGAQSAQLSAARQALQRHPQRWTAFEPAWKGARDAIAQCFTAAGKKDLPGAEAAAKKAIPLVQRARAIAFRPEDLQDTKASAVTRARACLSDLRSVEKRVANAPADIRAGMSSALKAALRLLFDTETVLAECMAASWKAHTYLVKAGLHAADKTKSLLEEKAREFGPELAQCLREIAKAEADAAALGLRGKTIAAKAHAFTPKAVAGALARAQLTQCHEVQKDIKRDYDAARRAAEAELRALIARGRGPATKAFLWMKSAVYSQVPDGGKPVSVNIPLSGSVKVEGIDVGAGMAVKAELSRKGETFYLTLKPSKSISLGVSAKEASAKLELKAGQSYTFALSAWRHLWEVAGFLGRGALESTLSNVVSAATGFIVPSSIVTDLMHLCHVGLTGEYLSSLKTLQGVGQELCLGVKASIKDDKVGAELEEGICGGVAVDRESGKVTAKVELGITAAVEISDFNKYFESILKGKLSKVLPKDPKFGEEVSVSAEIAFDCKVKTLPGASAGDMLQFISRVCPGALDRPVEATAEFSGGLILHKAKFSLTVSATNPRVTARPLLELVKKRNARQFVKTASAKASWAVSYTGTLLDKSKEVDAQAARFEAGITIEGAARQLCEGTISYAGGRIGFTLGKCQQDKIAAVERLLAKK